MTRTFITGNAGSGKTTLAGRVGRALDLPVTGLDRIVWQPGWRKSSPDQRASGIARLLAQPDWIAEGVSGALVEAADVVLFLDMPRRTCLLRCARRNWRYLFKSRPELPPGCPEILVIPTLVKLIWNFSANVRPAILAALATRRNGRDRIVRNRTELDAALAALLAPCVCGHARRVNATGSPRDRPALHLVSCALGRAHERLPPRHDRGN